MTIVRCKVEAAIMTIAVVLCPLPGIMPSSSTMSFAFSSEVAWNMHGPAPWLGSSPHIVKTAVLRVPRCIFLKEVVSPAESHKGLESSRVPAGGSTAVWCTQQLHPHTREAPEPRPHSCISSYICRRELSRTSCLSSLVSDSFRWFPHAASL